MQRKPLSSVAALAPLVVTLALACDPTGGGDAGLDAASDAAPQDAPAAIEDALADAPMLDAEAEDATMDLDAPGLDADSGPCEPCGDGPPCFELVGCECTAMPLPDGTTCGVAGELCLGGVCVGPTSGCGNGVRELTPFREGCDDGNTIDGDACSASCAPTLLVVSSPADEAFDVGAAVDGTGSVLFAWVEVEVSAGKPSLAVRARRYSPRGADAGPVLTLESGLGVGQAVTPVVAGLSSGWVVAWRSTLVEGVDADLGGIAYRVARADGSLGPTRQANTDERFDQRDPSIIANDTGFVIAWTDGSDRPLDPGLGVRARLFNVAGSPLAAAFTVATEALGDQSQPSLACSGRSMEWSVAFTDARSGTSTVRLRRYRGSAALDAEPLTLDADWSSGPVVSAHAAGLWAAWLGRSVDPMGQAHALFVPTGAAPPGLPIVAGDVARRDDGIAIAAIDATSAMLGWRTDASPQGLRLEPVGWVPPPELGAVEALLTGGRQRGLVLLPAADGLWLAWTDESISGATSAVVAYLLPWD